MDSEFTSEYSSLVERVNQLEGILLMMLQQMRLWPDNVNFTTAQRKESLGYVKEKKDILATLYDTNVMIIGKAPPHIPLGPWFYFDDVLFRLCFDETFKPKLGRNAMAFRHSSKSIAIKKDLSYIGSLDANVIKLTTRYREGDAEFTRFYEAYKVFPYWQTYIIRFFSLITVENVIKQLIADPEQDPHMCKKLLNLHLRNEFFNFGLYDYDIESLWRNIVWKIFGVFKLCYNELDHDTRVGVIFDDFEMSYLYKNYDLEEYERVLRFLLTRLYVVGNGDLQLVLFIFNTRMNNIFSRAGADFKMVKADSERVKIGIGAYRKVYDYYSRKQAKRTGKSRSRAPRVALSN